MSSFTNSRIGTAYSFLNGAYKAGRRSRERGEPITANCETSHSMRQSFERGWRQRDQELQDPSVAAHLACQMASICRCGRTYREHRATIREVMVCPATRCLGFEEQREQVTL